MSVIIGSARIDEKGNASGGAAGDQKQTSSTYDTTGEVSMQNFYVSSKGWNVFNWKKAEYAERAASEMKYACNNANIGYDQGQRTTLLSYVKKNGIKSLKDVKEKVETDCSGLIRVIIYIVTGIDIGDFYTGNEASVLGKTGLFNPVIAYTDSVTLYNGSVLVTKTKGHTVMVVSGTPVASQTTTSDFKPYKVAVNTKLNIRKSAGTSYAIIGVLNAGHKVTIREVSADGKWGKVDCYSDSNGKEVIGWISLAYTHKI